MFDDVLDYVSDSDQPRLVQLATAVRAGKPEQRVYRWSHALWVFIEGSTVRLRSGDGEVFELHPGEVDLLGRFLHHWNAHRHELAMFGENSGGYPPGFGGRRVVYMLPGRDSTIQTIGKGSMGKFTGEMLQGVDTRRRVVPGVEVIPGVQLVAETWRVGEKYGPSEGCPTARWYCADNALRIHASRGWVRLKRAGHKAILAESDVTLFDTLVGLTS